MYYIYRHIRKDTNEVFYIGKGLENTKRFKQTSSRNRYWHNIVRANGGFEYEIMIDGLTEKQAIEKEKEFISLYSESLCNMTEGGEGLSGYKHTRDTKNKISEKISGITRSKETCRKISESKKGKTINKKVPIFRETQEKAWKVTRRKVIDTKTGIIYESLRQASNELNINYSTLKNYLSGFRNNKTDLAYL